MSDPVVTLTFATADEALREVRTRCLADRAEPCDALWTATDAAIRDKNDHRYLLCSDGVFRPEVIMPPIKPGNFGAPPPKERDTSLKPRMVCDWCGRVREDGSESCSRCGHTGMIAALV